MPALGVLSVAPRRSRARGLLTPALTTPGGRYRIRWSEVAAQLLEERQAEQERDAEGD